MYTFDTTLSTPIDSNICDSIVTNIINNVYCQVNIDIKYFSISEKNKYENRPTIPFDTLFMMAFK